MVCERWSVTTGGGREEADPGYRIKNKNPTQSCGEQEPHTKLWGTRLPRKTKVDVTKCHACHAKRRWMSPSATPATQSAAASPATKTEPTAPPSAKSATPATQNEGGCDQVPGLPRKTKVDVAKCHACHAKCRGVTSDYPSAPPSTISATPATQNEGGCDQVPQM